MTTVNAAAAVVERILRDVPADDAWLSPRETEVLARLRFEARRRDWRLGRWTAKAAIAQAMATGGLAACDAWDIEILAAPDGAPEGFVRGDPAPCSLSLSHRTGRALAAVAPAGTPVGCDLEVVEPRAGAFVADYFTDRERDLVAESAPERLDLLVTLIWSAKEAALKAMRCGLRADTRWVEVGRSEAAATSDGWMPLVVDSVADGRVFAGGWRFAAGLIRTVVTGGAAPPPSRLDR